MTEAKVRMIRCGAILRRPHTGRTQKRLGVSPQRWELKAEDNWAGGGGQEGMGILWTLAMFQIFHVNPLRYNFALSPQSSYCVSLVTDDRLRLWTGGWMALRSSDWHGVHCLRKPGGDDCAVASSGPCWHSGRGHTSPELLPGRPWAQQWHWSRSAPAQCGIPSASAQRFCIGLVRAFSELRSKLQSENLPVNARSFPLFFQRNPLPSPAHSIFILHDHSPPVSLLHTLHCHLLLKGPYLTQAP